MVCAAGVGLCCGLERDRKRPVARNSRVCLLRRHGYDVLWAQGGADPDAARVRVSARADARLHGRGRALSVVTIAQPDRMSLDRSLQSVAMRCTPSPWSFDDINLADADSLRLPSFLLEFARGPFPPLLLALPQG